MLYFWEAIWGVKLGVYSVNWLELTLERTNYTLRPAFTPHKASQIYCIECKMALCPTLNLSFNEKLNQSLPCVLPTCWYCSLLSSLSDHLQRRLSHSDWASWDRCWHTESQLLPMKINITRKLVSVQVMMITKLYNFNIEITRVF